VTTIGLVIHCVADGMALGTSVFCNIMFLCLSFIVSERLKKESTLGFIVFLAILLHKAPGAIGFGTYLQHAGLQGN